jgi:preprotein translocase subunit SecG
LGLKRGFAATGARQIEDRRVTMWGYVLLTLLMLVGFFLMFVILLQRGRGGGLAGAFGGLGGQSAFGTKAGDVFTVITIVTVVVWVLLACLTGWRLRVEDKMYYPGRAEPVKKGEDAATGSKSEDADQSDSDKSPDTNKSAGPKAEKNARTGSESDEDESPKLRDEGGDAKTDAKKTGRGDGS